MKSASPCSGFSSSLVVRHFRYTRAKQDTLVYLGWTLLGIIEEGRQSKGA